MSLYRSDGDITFGWKSFGRSFAIFGALALAMAATGFLVMRGSSAHSVDPETQLLATAAEWIGGGLSILMAFAARGSIRISSRERGDVEISAEGVRRIFKPGKEDFLPLERIAGLVRRQSGGVLLIDRSCRRNMVIPRSIEGYRECVAELKAMGIKPLPADQLRIPGRRKRTFSENLLYYGLAAILNGLAVLYFDGRMDVPPPIRHILGVAGFAVFFTVFLFALISETRRRGRFSWISCLLVLLMLAAVIWRW